VNIGDIVVVIDTSSIPSQFFGHYGVITDVVDYAEDTKVVVEFIKRIDISGSLSHTTRISDLEKIGETNY
jgi:hypothetical protein